MPRSKSFSLTNAFSGATATIQQQEELKRLRQELDQLKTKTKLEKNQGLERLSEELKKFGGEQQVSIKAMRPSSQARQTLAKSAIKRRAESLKRHGQQTPLILIPLVGEEKLFEIEDGELRWRAAQLLVSQGDWEWEKLKAVLAPLPQEEGEVHKRSLIHNLHREELNSLDRIEAIVKQISLNVDLNLSEAEVEECDGEREKAIELKLKKIIRNLDYHFKKNQSEKLKMLQLLEASSEQQAKEIEQLQLLKIQQQILLIFLELQLNVSSVAANDLPMLTLPPDLKQAIRTNELPCRHALTIAKLSAKKLRKTEKEAISQRQEVVLEVVRESLSLKKTRELVAQLLLGREDCDQKRRRSREVTEVKSTISPILFSKLNNQDLTDLKEFLTTKLRELDKELSIRRSEPSAP